MRDECALALASFERLAELRGDITREVIELYYARFPDARASFERHGCGNCAELEGRMVASTVYLLFEWVEQKSTARIEQGTTIPHHNDSLEVGPRWYLGLIDAVLVILFETIPPDCADERRLWLRVRSEIAGYLDQLRSEFWRADHEGPLPGFEPDRALWKARIVPG